MEWVQADLPTGFWKSRHLHPVYGATRSRDGRSIWARASEVIPVTRTASKLNSKSLPFEHGTIYISSEPKQKTDIRGVSSRGIFVGTYGKLAGVRVVELAVKIQRRCSRFDPGKVRSRERYYSSPGTTSFASIGSSYSMKPKPFISLTSVIFPEPWERKCSSISCLVTGQTRPGGRALESALPNDPGQVNQRRVHELK
jgi:hypothetical protein